MADELTNATVDILGGISNYNNIQKNGNSKKGYSYCVMLDQEVFFDWCESLGFHCSSQGVYVETPGFRERMVQMGSYEYGPKPGLLWFFYN